MRNDLRAIVLVGLTVLLAGCGSDDDASAPTTSNDTRASGSKQSGTLYFERNDPGDYYKVMRMDMRSGRFEVAADGFDASVGNRSMAFLQLCSPLSVRLAVNDEDGFSSPVSECFKLDTITPDFYSPAMSRDDALIAVANTAILLPKDQLPDTAAARFGIGDNTYAATQIYRPDGTLVAELRDFGVGAWMRNGDLVVTGQGGDAGFGLYRVDRKFKNPERIDDGRINGAIFSIDAHPKKDAVVFIFNGQIFEMDIDSGKPKRVHSHGFPLAAAAYSPDGKSIIFVSSDPLSEAFETPNTGYNMYILKGGDVEPLILPFIPGGPLDWVK
ncbi:MAG: hypothetical protein AAF004_07325 [Pseudomonadota bacterium]